jgi:hypothetical protein
MPLNRCPACNRQVSDQAETCPGCGHPLGEERIPSNSVTLFWAPLTGDKIELKRVAVTRDRARVRGRPQKGKDAVLAALTIDKQKGCTLGADCLKRVGEDFQLDLTEAECSCPDYWEEFVNELFPYFVDHLNQEGYDVQGVQIAMNRAAPTVDSWSFLVPQREQRDIRTLPGSGSVTGPMSPPATREEIERRQQEARKRVARGHLSAKPPLMPTPKERLAKLRTRTAQTRQT